jgi:hypothetical protein
MFIGQTPSLRERFLVSAFEQHHTGPLPSWRRLWLQLMAAVASRRRRRRIAEPPSPPKTPREIPGLPGPWWQAHSCEGTCQPVPEAAHALEHQLVTFRSNVTSMDALPILSSASTVLNFAWRPACQTASNLPGQLIDGAGIEGSPQPPLPSALRCSGRTTQAQAGSTSPRQPPPVHYASSPA